MIMKGKGIMSIAVVIAIVVALTFPSGSIAGIVGGLAPLFGTFIVVIYFLFCR